MHSHARVYDEVPEVFLIDNDLFWTLLGATWPPTL